jgi:hypothetical protein
MFQLWFSLFIVPLPVRGLHINPRGDVKTCCAGDPNMLGNLNDQSIEQILQWSIYERNTPEHSARAATSNTVATVSQAERYGRIANAIGTTMLVQNLTIPQRLDEQYPTLIDGCTLEYHL